MATPEIDLPDGWTRLLADELLPSDLVGYELTTEPGMQFRVSVHERPGSAYRILLSTLVLGTDVPRRQDYPVAEYEREDDTLAETEAFLFHVTPRLDDGGLATTEPTVEDVEAAVCAFTEEEPSPFGEPVAWLLNQLP